VPGCPALTDRLGEADMKKKIRRSNTKKGRKSGFRTRNKSHSGRKIIARKRSKGTTFKNRRPS
jgi:ribosomal protein L34